MFSFSLQTYATFHYCFQHVSGIRSHQKWISHIQNRNCLHQDQIHCRRSDFLLLLLLPYETMYLPGFMVYCVLDTYKGYRDPISFSDNFMECFHCLKWSWTCFIRVRAKVVLQQCSDHTWHIHKPLYCPKVLIFHCEITTSFISWALK